MRRGLLNDVRTLDKQQLSMTVQRFVALGLTKNAPIPEQFPIPKLTIQQDTQIAVASKFAVTGNDKILALCPGQNMARPNVGLWLIMRKLPGKKLSKDGRSGYLARQRCGRC